MFSVPIKRSLRLALMLKNNRHISCFAAHIMPSLSSPLQMPGGPMQLR